MKGKGRLLNVKVHDLVHLEICEIRRIFRRKQWWLRLRGQPRLADTLDMVTGTLKMTGMLKMNLLRCNNINRKPKEFYVGDFTLFC